MTQKFIDRIFIEIDNNTIKLEKIAKSVYINSTNIDLLKKLIFIIVTFIILTSLGMIYKTTTGIDKEKKEISLLLKDTNTNHKLIKRGEQEYGQ